MIITKVGVLTYQVQDFRFRHSFISLPPQIDNDRTSDGNGAGDFI